MASRSGAFSPSSAGMARLPALLSLNGHSGARFQGIGRAPEWLAPFRRERACLFSVVARF